MAQIGIVTGREIIENKDSEQKSLMLQVELSEEEDVQTVELYKQAGEDYSPPNDSTVVIIDISGSFKVGVAVDDNIESVVDPGERLLYSSDNEIKKATIYLKKDGIIELNGDTDFAVAFNDLKTAFDQLKSDFDDAMDIIDNHIHATTATIGADTTVGVISKPTGPVPTYLPVTPGVPGIDDSTANIDPAKVATIKVP